MLAVKLPKTIERRLKALARKSGRDPASLASQAIVTFIDELEDAHLAQARALKNRQAIPLAELAQLLRLDHA